MTSERDRVLHLSGGHNFRDIGGYPAADGRSTAWGLVYRSGTMAELEPAGHAALKQLGLRAICDLRSSGERRRRPSRLPSSADFEILSFDYESSSADLASVLSRDDASAAISREFIIGAYREIAYEQAPGYRTLFERLASGKLPILFHCAAGKDRTGVAAALLLDILGVARATVVEDYVLTDRFLDRGIELVKSDPWMASVSSLDPAIWRPVMRADPAYLAAMFEMVETRHGSAEGYVREVLGLDQAEIAAIRSALLV